MPCHTRAYVYYKICIIIMKIIAVNGRVLIVKFVCVVVVA